MPDRKRVPIQRVVERAAVNAARAIFELHRQIYIEVDQANDYGRDAYVDLTDDGTLTGQVIAVQVKGGVSYKSDAGHFIPYTVSDRALWVNSSVPVFGIVHDPDTSLLYWVNLTDYLSNVSSDRGGRVPVVNPLGNDTWSGFMIAAESSSKHVGALLGLFSDEPNEQGAAVWDCFALGRFDARALIMLGTSLKVLHPSVLPGAVFALSHCVLGHPDIFWSDRNTVPSGIKSAVMRKLQWSPDDAVLLLSVVDDENMFRRGSDGEHAYLLLTGPLRGLDLMELLGGVLDGAIRRNDEVLATKVLAIMQYQVDEDAPTLMRSAFDEYPALASMRGPRELFDAVMEHGWLDIA